MKDNLKYSRIKKIHQVLEKITRIDQKTKFIVSSYHINCCLQNYTTHQFTYFIYYLCQDKFKYPKIIKIQQVCKTIFIILFKLFSIGDSFKVNATQEMRLI